MVLANLPSSSGEDYTAVAVHERQFVHPRKAKGRAFPCDRRELFYLETPGLHKARVNGYEPHRVHGNRLAQPGTRPANPRLTKV